MKRLLLSCCILLCVVSAMQAQEQSLISPDDSIRSLVGRLFPNSNPDISAHMNLQFSTSGVANFVEGDLEDASFKLNRVKLEILVLSASNFLIISVSRLINTVIRTRWIIYPLLLSMLW